MVIYIGADHRGFKFKESIKAYLKNQGYEVVDVGAESYVEGDDYTHYARAVAEKITADPDQSRGILICGSGVGVDVTANKFPAVRSGLAISPDQIYAARNDDNINVLSLASDYMEEAIAKNLRAVIAPRLRAFNKNYKLPARIGAKTNKAWLKLGQLSRGDRDSLIQRATEHAATAKPTDH